MVSFLCCIKVLTSIQTYPCFCFCVVSDRLRPGGEQWRDGLLRLLHHRGLPGLSSGGLNVWVVVFFLTPFNIRKVDLCPLMHPWWPLRTVETCLVTWRPRIFMQSVRNVAVNVLITCVGATPCTSQPVHQSELEQTLEVARTIELLVSGADQMTLFSFKPWKHIAWL